MAREVLKSSNIFLRISKATCIPKAVLVLKEKHEKALGSLTTVGLEGLYKQERKWQL